MRTRRLYRFVLISHECGLDSLGAGLRHLQAGAVPAGSQRLRFRLHTGGRGRRALPFHFVALEETSEFQVLPGNHRSHLDRCRHHNASVARRLSPRLHFGYIGLLRAWLLFIKKKKEKKIENNREDISKTDRVCRCARKNGRILIWATFISPWPI